MSWLPGPALMYEIEGVWSAKSSKREMLSPWISSAVIAWMLTGVSWMLLSRLRAVTITSSIAGWAPSSSAWAMAGAAAIPDAAAMASASRDG